MILERLEAERAATRTRTQVMPAEITNDDSSDNRALLALTEVQRGEREVIRQCEPSEYGGRMLLCARMLLCGLMLAPVPTEVIREPLRGEREVITEPLRGDRAASSRLPEPLLPALLALLALQAHELGFWRREGSVPSGLTRLVPTLLALPRNLLALLVHKLVEKVTWVGRGGKSVGGRSSAAEW